MKFCKKYEEYMQGQKEKKNLPGVGFKKLKKILKRCRRNHVPSRISFTDAINHNCSRECPVCDGTFFPELLKEMEDVVGWFNEHAQKLLELHLASGFTKCLTWLRGNSRKKDHHGLIQEGKDLVNYALINAVAIRKILKKYDKIHESRQGQAFKTQVQKMRIEILQSPWLCELMAFHINLKESKKESGATITSPPPPVHALFDGCALTFDDGKPLLSFKDEAALEMELDLGLSLSPHKSSKLGFNFDLNKHCAIEGAASCLGTEKLRFEATFGLGNVEENCYMPKQRLFALNGQPNEEDEDPLESESSIVYDDEEENSEVVGWPPVKTCMIKYGSYHHRHIRNHHHCPYHHRGRRITAMNNNISNPTTATVGSSSSSSISSRSSMYVKVKMDGVAIARKVDIKLFNSYESLTNSLITMFTEYEDCDREDTNYTFTFQGKEGDWLLRGDVTWKIFAESVHRISIIRDRPCAYTRCLF